MFKYVLLLSTVCTFLQSVAQNSCEMALTLEIGTHAIGPIDGDPAPACFGQTALNAEWYRFTSAADTGLVITTDLPQNFGGDTRIHVFTGTCDALTCIATDDDAGNGFLSTVSFTATANVTYTIVLDNYWSSSGTDLQIAYSVPPVVPAGMVTFTPTPVPAGGSYTYCVVDMNGDHLDDVVSVSNQQVVVARQQIGGGFNTVVMPTPLAAHMPSWSIAAGDINGDGLNDLLYGGGGGATFMIQNEDGSAFYQQPFTQYIFSQRTNMVDINNDGHLDAFVCHDVAPNVYFMNDGNGTLQFNQGGLGPNGGNYGSIWTDHDNDSDLDLFVAKCGSSPPDVLMQNNGDGTFTDVAPMYGMADGHQAWSSAWGDFDNDGDMDVLIGQSASPSHKLLRNDMGSFIDVTAGSGVNFAYNDIEWVTHDLDNDGWLDILGGGTLLYNNGDLTFTGTHDAPYNGPIGDLNNDGFLDVLNDLTAQMNNGNDNNWIKVHPIGTLSNTNAIGARIEIVTPSGTQIREVRSGDGFRYMSTLTVHFGLGQDENIEELTIRWPSGTVQTIASPAINTTHVITEEITTGIRSEMNDELVIHPNPATDLLVIDGMIDVVDYAIFNSIGQQILNGKLANARLDVSLLAPGSYVLEIIDRSATRKKARFTKL